MKNNVRLKQCFLSTSVFVFLFYVSRTIVEKMSILTMKGENDTISIDLGDNQSCSERQNDAFIRISNYCQSISKDRIQRSWRKLPGVTLITEENKKLAYCHVPKVASTAWMMSFAEMNLISASDIKSMNNANSLHDYLYNTFSIKIEKPDDASLLSNLYTITFIRHPFERLVSAFHDKFIVGKQINLMMPFIEYYTRLKGMKKPKKVRQSWIDKYIDVSFRTFIDFVLFEYNEPEKISDPSTHWWPYMDICKLCEIKFDYVGKLEALKNDVECILDAFPNYAKLQQMKLKIRKKVNAKGNHSTNMTMEYFSQLSKETVVSLYKMYEDDFKLGGYEYPKKYIDIAGFA